MTPSRYGYLELDAVVKAPGIYAWYIEFPMSENDWQTQVVDGLDRGVSAASSALRDFATYFRQRPINLKGAGDYGASWAGSLAANQLDETLAELLLPEAPGESPDSAQPAPMHEIIHNSNEREILGKALRAVTPVFSSPIYIGVASDLHARLASHKRNYESAHKILMQRPEQREALEAASKLGARIAAAGIPLEYLAVYTLEVGAASKLPLERRGEVAKQLEWLLQRTFKPIMGRR